MHVPDVVVARQYLEPHAPVQQVGKARVAPAISAKNRVADYIDYARPIVNLRHSNEYKIAGRRLFDEHEPRISPYHGGRSATHGACNSIPSIRSTRAAKIFNVIPVDGCGPAAIGKDGMLLDAIDMITPDCPAGCIIHVDCGLA